MPQKKKNTTLVTEDELMEAVSARVTDNFRRELDDRFAGFERMLQQFAPQNPAPADTAPSQTGKRPAEDDLPLHPRAHRPANDIENNMLSDNVHSSLTDSTRTAGQSAAQTPAITIAHDSMRPPTSRPEVARPPFGNVNNNNNNNTATWTAWQAIQQPFSSRRCGFPGSPGGASSHKEPSLEDQVRYIMEATPHQLTGKQPTGGFPFPYKYVTRGPEKRRLSFNTVTLAEHIWGIFRMLDDECTDPTIKPFLMAHMKEVAEDACEYKWSTHVRRWSEEVFNMIAEKRLPEGWNSTARIQNLRTGMSRVDGARLPPAVSKTVLIKRNSQHRHSVSILSEEVLPVPTLMALKAAHYSRGTCRMESSKSTCAPIVWQTPPQLTHIRRHVAGLNKGTRLPIFRCWPGPAWPTGPDTHTR